VGLGEGDGVELAVAAGVAAAVGVPEDPSATLDGAPSSPCCT
jgi:hypothetical protein